VSIVKVNNFSKELGDVTAVDNLNFQIAQGELFGLLGPNGAGKTTTVRMLCSLIAGGSKRNGKI